MFPLPRQVLPVDAVGGVGVEPQLGVRSQAAADLTLLGLIEIDELVTSGRIRLEWIVGQVSQAVRPGGRMEGMQMLFPG